MGKLKLTKAVAEHFFGAAAVEKGIIDSLPTVQTKPSHTHPKMKIKFFDVKEKTHHTATVVEVLGDEKLRVVEDTANAPIIHVINAKDVTGLYLASLGNEIELSFGVGKVSSSSLTDEGY